jgi:predicted transcriptional regulator
MSPPDNPTTMQLTAQIVSAHVSNNRVAPDELPRLIESVYNSLAGANTAVAALVVSSEPAVPVKQSVKPNSITCLACGKNFKMLKRHLNTDHKLGIVEYRQRYQLPANYPMVAPNYAKVRSTLAKEIGLGKFRKQARKQRRITTIR